MVSDEVTADIVASLGRNTDGAFSIIVEAKVGEDVPAKLYLEFTDPRFADLIVANLRTAINSVLVAAETQGSIVAVDKPSE